MELYNSVKRMGEVGLHRAEAFWGVSVTTIEGGALAVTAESVAICVA